MMNPQTSELDFLDPRGFQVQSGLLQEFERGLNPLDPQSSRMSLRCAGIRRNQHCFRNPSWKVFTTWPLKDVLFRDIG